MKQEKEQEKYIEILQKGLPKKITSEFVRKYYSAIHQARLGLKDLNEFEDAIIMNGLAGLDCVALDLDFSELSQEEFEKIAFDTKTIFSEETKKQFNPAQILERAKSFGLGLEKTGLTGKGIHIAIRDENCNPYLTDANVVEYTKIKDGKTTKEVNSNDTEHMHGLTVTSLLASHSCGIAKDALVHFFNSSIVKYDEEKKKNKHDSAAEIESFISYIIAHNQKCREENRDNDMILVASGSWADRAFEAHRDKLREVGCELVCANNFNKNFGEFVNNDGSVHNPLELSEEEIQQVTTRFSDPNLMKQIKIMSDRDKVKIPITRTYHQVGSDGISEPLFKYQSSFSTSWGIPQVAGLLTVFKEMDRTLTFDQFLEYAERTAIGEMKIINPEGIYREIEKSLLKGKTALDDCMQDTQITTSLEQNATKVVKDAILGIDKVLDENEVGESK